MQKCFIEKLNSTKLIEHLGGFGPDWLLRVECCPEGYSLVDCHPGTKGPKFSPVKIASSAAIGHMGSVLMD